MSAINSFASTGGAPTTGRGIDELTSEEFLNIMLNELSAQDPLEPNDTSTLIQQISDLRSIEADLDLSDQLTEFARSSEIASAAGLIGAVVGGLNDFAQRAAGTVISVTRTSEGAILNLDTGERMRMSNVDEIVQPAVIQDILDPIDDDTGDETTDQPDDEQPDDEETTP